MEYERIHKVQTGLLSPSKLRMKLVGVHQRKNKDGSNSNCNSSRTSPSKVGDSEFVKNSLLAASDFEEEGALSWLFHFYDSYISCTYGTTTLKLSGDTLPNGSQSIPETMDNSDFSHPKTHHYLKGEFGNSSTVHPLKAYEDENLDYDSTSSFEFHKGERSMHHSIARSFFRPMPSKWNDAEKWIMSRQNMQANHPSKKVHFQNQTNRMPGMSMVRVAPESTSIIESKLAVKRVDFCQPSSNNGSHTISGHGNISTALIDLSPESNDLAERDDGCLTEDEGTTDGIRSVSMRDMGTEMTPIPSQEPSRTATPTGATTPLRSPTSSIPSTPRRGGEVPPPTTLDYHHALDNHSNSNYNIQLENSIQRDLSEQELKLKTRKEIVSLGLQLGKTNIAAWASKDQKERESSDAQCTEMTELEHEVEFAKRAAAWEEVEKSKHAARFKREEIKIQAWESQQGAKLEAEIRRIEAQVEKLRAQGQAKMVKKIAMARQKSEEKRAMAEARKNRLAEKTASDAEYIRQTGRFPSSTLMCCGW